MSRAEAATAELSSTVTASEVAAMLREWLLARSFDPATATEARGAMPEILGWFREGTPEGEANARALIEALGRKLASLGAFLGEGARSIPEKSSLARWRTAVSATIDAWGRRVPGDWRRIGEDLARRKNPVWCSALIDALLETSEGAARSVGLKGLREREAGEFARCSVPPGLGASWTPTEYLDPVAEAALVSELERAYVAADRLARSPAGAVLIPSLTALRASLSAARTGWPIPIASTLRALETIASSATDIPEIPKLVSELARRSRPPEDSVAPAGDAAPPAGPSGHDAAFLALGERLRALKGADVEGMARRVSELAEIRDPAEKRRRLYGCLRTLDAELVVSAPGGWRSSALNELLRVARTIPRCEVLDESLTNQPVGMAASLIDVVETDSAGASPVPRVTAVLRPGFALLGANGEREGIIRAKVRATS